MPFTYSVSSGIAGGYSSHATPSTEDAYLALRQATRGFNLGSLWVAGRGAGLTTLSGISHRAKRWTTVGTGGTALTPAPRRIGTTAATGAVDKQTTLTPGTVSGVYLLVIGCGGAGPGGWTARDEDAKIHVEAGSSDEVAVYSVSGTASMVFDASVEIDE